MSAVQNDDLARSLEADDAALRVAGGVVIASFPRGAQFPNDARHVAAVLPRTQLLEGEVGCVAEADGAADHSQPLQHLHAARKR